MLKTLKSRTRDLLIGTKKNRRMDHKIKKIVMCKKCYSFYYKKSWRFEKPVSLHELTEDEALVKFTDCTACLEQENVFFETDGILAFS